jgi:phosphoribosylanthranilate isomerase
VNFRIKICGLRDPDQAVAIARLGASALGVIAVAASPRYVTPDAVARLRRQLDAEAIAVPLVGVFAEPAPADLDAYVEVGGIGAIQLHREESPQFCAQVRERFPQLELIKALRIRQPADLARADNYRDCVDTLLLDAWHPEQLGGTGESLDWNWLEQFRPGLPWLLAGGIGPANVAEAIARACPDGVDLSSAVERAPADKDLDRVAELMSAIRQATDLGGNGGGR